VMQNSVKHMVNSLKFWVPERHKPKNGKEKEKDTGKEVIQRIRGFLKRYALYTSTFYLLTYLLTY